MVVGNGKREGLKQKKSQKRVAIAGSKAGE